MLTAISCKIEFLIRVKGGQNGDNAQMQRLLEIALAIYDAAKLTKPGYYLGLDNIAGSAAVTLSYEGDAAREFVKPDELRANRLKHLEIARKKNWAVTNRTYQELISAILERLVQEDLLQGIERLSVVQTITQSETSSPDTLFKPD